MALARFDTARQRRSDRLHLRRQAAAAERERRTAALYAMSRDLTAAAGVDEILQAAARHISSVFLSQVLLLLPDEAGHVTERASEKVTFLLDAREQAVAQWVFDHGRMAGKTTDTLPAAKIMTNVRPVVGPDICPAAERRGGLRSRDLKSHVG